MVKRLEVDQIVDQARRKCVTEMHAKKIHDHFRQAREQRMQRIENGCLKDEGELNRLGDARDEDGQRHR
jgi:hypothetical protein